MTRNRCGLGQNELQLRVDARSGFIQENEARIQAFGEVHCGLHARNFNDFVYDAL
ncbi:hypothetical protein [Caballeronia choica]|uniref:hypothetical protein n=1 Tax=Caballeronia choica TaxID=326476 RepID=UPI001F18DD4A|nr:hypothetical protein [Caballeronia choica]